MIDAAGLVPPTGIEPVQPCGREILSLLRLPIPPWWQLIAMFTYGAHDQYKRLTTLR